MNAGQQSQTYSPRRRRSAMYGAISGSLLLPLFVFSVWERKTLLEGEHAIDALPLLPTALSIPIGAIIGCVIGFGTWIASTPRPVHPLYVCFAYGFLFLVVSVPLYGLYWSYITPDTGSGGGLGSTMQAIGLFWNYVLFVLPASVIGGLVLGWIVGVVKRNRWSGRQ